MPFRIKIGLSVAVVLTIIAGYVHQGAVGHEGAQWALLFLGPFTIVALWIFPEVMRKPADNASPGETLRGTEVP